MTAGVVLFWDRTGAGLAVVGLPNAASATVLACLPRWQNGIGYINETILYYPRIVRFGTSVAIAHCEQPSSGLRSLQVAVSPYCEKVGQHGALLCGAAT